MKGRLTSADLSSFSFLNYTIKDVSLHFGYPLSKLRDFPCAGSFFIYLPDNISGLPAPDWGAWD